MQLSLAESLSKFDKLPYPELRKSEGSENRCSFELVSRDSRSEMAATIGSVSTEYDPSRSADLCRLRYVDDDDVVGKLSDVLE